MSKSRALGLAADPTETAGLMDSDADVGSDIWGIPMTAAEEARVDLPGRMKFAVDVGQSVIPALEDLPTFAAAYFDSTSNGELVVALTEIDESVAAKIEGKVTSQPVRWYSDTAGY